MKNKNNKTGLRDARECVPNKARGIYMDSTPVLSMLCVIIIMFLIIFAGCAKNNGKQVFIKPRKGEMKSVISITGVVEPMNRLEIKPPVPGRIERVPVKEGDYVHAGDTVAYLSSAERAALLDMAKAKGPEETKKWTELYKPILITAPIGGTVIVRGVEPGQSVGTGDAVIVLSDKLIVNAQADETDIGRIKKGAKARAVLDAFPSEEVGCRVTHISYESKVVNNVAVYNVRISPDAVPDFFRSGMSANVDIIEKISPDALMLPVSAIKSDRKGQYVTVKNGAATEKKYVETGISENGFTEITSGLSADDSVLTDNPGTVRKKGAKAGSGSPFMPSRRPGR